MVKCNSKRIKCLQIHIALHQHKQICVILLFCNYITQSVSCFALSDGVWKLRSHFYPLGFKLVRKPANQNKIQCAQCYDRHMKTVQLTQNVGQRVSGKESHLNGILKYGQDLVKEEGGMRRKTHKGQQIIRKCEVLSATYGVNEGYQAVPCAMLIFWIFFCPEGNGNFKRRVSMTFAKLCLTHRGRVRDAFSCALTECSTNLFFNNYLTEFPLFVIERQKSTQESSQTEKGSNAHSSIYPSFQHLFPLFPWASHLSSLNAKF